MKRKTKQKKTTALPAVIFPAVVDDSMVTHYWGDDEDMLQFVGDAMAKEIEKRWHHANMAVAIEEDIV